LDKEEIFGTQINVTVGGLRRGNPLVKCIRPRPEIIEFAYYSLRLENKKRRIYLWKIKFNG